MATDYDRAIDETLQLIYSQVHRFRRSLYGPTPDAISSLDALRDGPVGQNLRWLARVARGEERADFRAVSESARAVLDLLLFPIGAESYDIAQPFWDEPLGRMLAQAKWRCAAPDDLISIGAAAEYLGVARPTIYRWMAMGVIESVRDGASARFFLLRSEIARLQGNAARMEEEQDALLYPDRLASEAADDD
jgi:excisionase family DNA binding protein